MTSRITTGLDALRRAVTTRSAAPGAVVLAYHDIVDEPTTDPWSVSVDSFSKHLAMLERLGLSIVDLHTIVDRMRRGHPVDGLAAITFDDALVGVHRHAVPVLARAKAPATVFVVSGHLGVDPPWWPGAARTMTVDELGDLARSGIRLASHTRSHPSLLSVSTDELEAEIAGSRDELAALTSEPIELFAYPSGHHDSRVRDAVHAAGFVAAFTFLNGRVTGTEDPYRLPRLTMGDHLRPARLAYQLLRDPASWPDHQLDRVGAGG